MKKRLFPIPKDKIDQKTPNRPEKAHYYQEKSEKDKNDSSVSSKTLPKKRLQGSQFFLLWKLKSG